METIFLTMTLPYGPRCKTNHKKCAQAEGFLMRFVTIAAASLTIAFMQQGCTKRSGDVEARSGVAQEQRQQVTLEQQHPSVTQSKLITDSIEAIFREFGANSVRAQQKYVGDQLIVRGTITQILNPSVFLSCPSSDQSRAFQVECVFKGSEITSLNVGQTITALGTMRDGNSLMIYLHNCELRE